MNVATSTITSSIGPPGTGIEIERISTSALEAIAALLPGERGLPFFSLLLSYAQDKQLILDDGSSVPVGVVSLSLESFARKNGLSKDTALRYVAILHALQIVKRRRGELHIPLVEWRPTHEIITALDQLISSARRKLQQLAMTVRSKFLLLYGTCDKRETFLADLADTLLEIQKYFSRSLGRAKRALLERRVARLSDRLQVMQQKGDFSLGEVLGLITQQKGDESVPGAAKWSPSSSEKGDRAPDQTSSLVQKGDFSLASRTSQSSSDSKKGDRENSQPTRESSSRGEKGDFSLANEGQRSSSLVQKGDRIKDLASSVQQKGDFSPQSLLDAGQKGDFSGAGASLNVNVNSIFSNDKIQREDDNVNDQSADDHLAEATYDTKGAQIKGRELADFLEKGHNVGGFINKCKVSTPTQVQASVISALVHFYFPKVDPANDKGRPNLKGAWFHDICNGLIAGSPIKPYVQKWLTTEYSVRREDWQKIDHELREASAKYNHYLSQNKVGASYVRRWLWGEISDQERDQALSQLPQEARTPVLEVREEGISDTPPKGTILTSRGQHILDIYEQFKGRKIIQTDVIRQCANTFGEFVTNDDDFLAVLQAIADDPFIKGKDVRWDLEYALKKYDQYYDRVQRRRTETKPDYNAIAGQSDQEREEYRRRQKAKYDAKAAALGIDREVLMSLPPAERIAYVKQKQAERESSAEAL